MNNTDDQNHEDSPALITRELATATAKSFRQSLDRTLQEMKDHLATMKDHLAQPGLSDEMVPAFADSPEDAIAQHQLSIHELEAAIMRQGMVLKSIGATNPYPQSYDPTSPQIEPTADGLKL